MRISVFFYLVIVCFSAPPLKAKSACDSVYFSKIIEQGIYLQNHHKHDEVITLVDSILRFHKNKENCQYVLKLLNMKALVLEHSQHFEESIAIATDVISSAQKYKMYDIEAKSFLILVRIHDFLQRENDLNRNLAKAKALIDRHQLLQLLPEYYVRAASYQRFFGTRDSSLYFANQAISWGEKYDDYINLADAHMLEGVYHRGTEKATRSMLTSIEYFKKVGEQSAVAISYVNVIKSLLTLGKIRETNEYIDSASVYLANLEKTPRVYDTKEHFYDLISQKYEQEGKTDSAIFYIKLARIYSDSSQFVTNEQFINDKEIEIATLKEKALVNEISKSRRLWIIGFILLSMGLLLLAHFYRRTLRFQKLIFGQNHEILTQKNELTTLLTKQTMLLAEVHHRVKNNLQIVISLLTLKVQNSKDHDTAKYLEDVSMKIRSISLIHEQLYNNDQFDEINVNGYVRQLLEQFRNILSATAYTSNIKINDGLTFNIETMFPIGIILTELVTNSIKHANVQSSNTLNIQIEIKEVDKNYLLFYSDNGTGKLNEKAGMGSSILAAMKRQLNARNTEYNKGGYHFEMEFVMKTVSVIG
ncbi:MAG TPA: sensor histidine kinase [Saprospiraceae bacterium]|nr:sensor histidine kinase [Saprospiraceae bacterium]